MSIKGDETFQWYNILIVGERVEMEIRMRMAEKSINNLTQSRNLGNFLQDTAI